MSDPDSSQATLVILPSRRKRNLALGPLVLMAGVVALALMERQVFSYGPPCVLHRLTGWNCPGCGGTRAFFALMHGELLRSLRYNPLTLVILIGLAAWLIRALLEAISADGRWTRPLAISSRTLWIIATAVILFGILRNLPWCPFTLLAPPV